VASGFWLGTRFAPLFFVGVERQDLCGRALRFAGAVLRLHGVLASDGAATGHLAGQLLRASTAIGANLEEGQVANSRRDMAQKYALALREARESLYWLRLVATFEPHASTAEPLIREANELVAILTVSVRKLRQPP
jgi:four helix bundle protein